MGMILQEGELALEARTVAVEPAPKILRLLLVLRVRHGFLSHTRS